MKLFALESSRRLGEEGAVALGAERAAHEERELDRRPTQGGHALWASPAPPSP